MKTSMLNFSGVNFQKTQTSHPQFEKRVNTPNSINFQGHAGMDRVELKSKSAAIQSPALKFAGGNNLHQAIQKGMSNEAFDKLVKEVERRGDTETLNEKGGPEDEAPLLAAIRRGKLYMVARLLGAPGIDLTERTKEGLLPVELADTLISSDRPNSDGARIHRMLDVAK